jgi:hypothetical protein
VAMLSPDSPACYGAGGYVDADSQLTVRSSVVSGNYYDYSVLGTTYGGGFYVAAGGTLDVRETVISSNTAGDGASVGYGSAVANDGGTVWLQNVLAAGNTSIISGENGGGAVWSDGASGASVLINCTVADNTGEGARRVDGVFAVTNSILWGNGVDSTGVVTIAWSCYSNSTDHVNGGDNITSDPLFVDTTYYHLQSTEGNYINGYFSGGSWSTSAADSPCLNAGDPASDKSREPEPNGGQINMGAYGGTEVASMRRAPRGTLFRFR